ncbi:extracellular elastinolytic metalloproteinase [Purpureocillium lilacinum]|uniref:Extracellular metalloproteinase n=1 Tax=Purpureocillium lilacinum TaxID=33203 RepID=A0A179GM84_PURLI|nr:extracellular elastinolytic metalloproteinase [Purpureocillium lilacinum]
MHKRLLFVCLGIFTGGKAIVRRSGQPHHGIDVEQYRIKQSSFYHRPSSGQHTLGVIDAFNPPRQHISFYNNIATALVKEVAPGTDFLIMGSSYVDELGNAHVYVSQTLNGMAIKAANINVNLRPNGSVISYGDSFVRDLAPQHNPLAKRDFISGLQAAEHITQKLQIPIKVSGADIERLEGPETYRITTSTNGTGTLRASLQYVQANGVPKLSWCVEVISKEGWLETCVDANNPQEILAIVHPNHSAANGARYNVIAPPGKDPSEAPSRLATEPIQAARGWATESQGHLVLQGNNARMLIEGQPAQIAAQGNTFNFRYSEQAPSLESVKACATNAFYVVNDMHDIMSTLGFTEESGNFQATNYKANGRGAGDPVVIDVVYSSDMNAGPNFQASPDGQSPRLNLVLLTNDERARLPCMDNFIVIHEFVHGVSNRLTGGPDNPACLTPVIISAWIGRDPNGIRSHPYSTDLKVNPLTLEDLGYRQEVHDAGEVWCTMLNEVMWALIGVMGRGNSTVPELNEKGVATDGRFFAVQLVMAGMKMQPCNPGVFEARNAIMDALESIAGDKFSCAVWTAWAKRGFGAGAQRGQFVNDFTGHRVQILVLSQGRKVRFRGHKVRSRGRKVLSRGRKVRILVLRVHSLGRKVLSLGHRVRILVLRVHSLGRKVRLPGLSPGA